MVILHTSPHPFSCGDAGCPGLGQTLPDGRVKLLGTGQAVRRVPKHPMKGSGMPHSPSLPSVLSHPDAERNNQYDMGNITPGRQLFRHDFSGCLLHCSSLLSGVCQNNNSFKWDSRAKRTRYSHTVDSLYLFNFMFIIFPIIFLRPVYIWLAFPELPQSATCPGCSTIRKTK